MRLGLLLIHSDVLPVADLSVILRHVGRQQGGNLTSWKLLHVLECPLSGPEPAPKYRGWGPECRGHSPSRRSSRRARGRLVPEPRARNHATAVAHRARRIPRPLARQLIVPAPLEPSSAPTPRTGDRRLPCLRLVPEEEPLQTAAGHPDSFVTQHASPTARGADCAPEPQKPYLKERMGRASSCTARMLVGPRAPLSQERRHGRSGPILPR
jgi:hypothetical protein